MNALLAVAIDPLTEFRQKALGAVRIAQAEMARMSEVTDVHGGQDATATLLGREMTP